MAKTNVFQKYIIGNIYRLPSYISDDLIGFTDEYINLLNLLRTRSKFVYLCGDYNIQGRKQDLKFLGFWIYMPLCGMSRAAKLAAFARGVWGHAPQENF